MGAGLATAGVGATATMGMRTATMATTTARSGLWRWLPWVIGAALLLFLWSLFSGNPFRLPARCRRTANRYPLPSRCRPKSISQRGLPPRCGGQQGDRERCRFTQEGEGRGQHHRLHRQDRRHGQERGARQAPCVSRIRRPESRGRGGRQHGNETAGLRGDRHRPAAMPRRVGWRSASSDRSLIRTVLLVRAYHESMNMQV